jgi:hypothetical protein
MPHINNTRLHDAFRKQRAVASFYAQSGNPLPLVITVRPAANHAFGPPGTPTGLVYNPTDEFVISKNGKSTPAIFIFNSRL